MLPFFFFASLRLDFFLSLSLLSILDWGRWLPFLVEGENMIGRLGRERERGLGKGGKNYLGLFFFFNILCFLFFNWMRVCNFYCYCVCFCLMGFFVSLLWWIFGMGRFRVLGREAMIFGLFFFFFFFFLKKEKRKDCVVGLSLGIGCKFWLTEWVGK